MKSIRTFCFAALAAAICSLAASSASSHLAQAVPQKPAEKVPEKTQEESREKPKAKSTPEVPAQIELLETNVRFETNGSSRKEVHARVKINDELGVRQFGRLNFDFNRSFQQVELPLVRITHPSGGVIDVLPSAVTDQPKPAVVNAAAYQDVRVKSVRILGLEPGDTLEYRVLTTTSHAPLAPDFWFEHTFDRSGVVSHEVFKLDLPASRKPDLRINPATPPASTEKSGNGDQSRAIYRWELAADSLKKSADSSKDSEQAVPDVLLSTESWEMLSVKLDEKLTPGATSLEKIVTDEHSMKGLSRKYQVAPEISAKALELTKGDRSNREKLEALYDFVSQKIRTIDLPLGATGFAARPAKDVLDSSYATPEDKIVLLAALSFALKFNVEPALTGYCDEKGLPRPSAFKHILLSAYDGKSHFWLDPSLEVAPFGEIPANSGKCAFLLDRTFVLMNSSGHEWQKLDTDPPFPSTQRVTITAGLSGDGTLKSKVRYSMRGQNELVLRIAFHQAPKENWKNVAQLLALSDGFRGQITSVDASDPYETHHPFHVEYEITEPKFVNWSKKPVRIPALLPLLGLPDPAPKTPAGHASQPIDLGTPLDVEVSATVHLPESTGAEVPAGTTVDRDFATYTSQYSAKNATITATRHLNFIMKEIPADRAADYDAFLRAVQNDESQFFTLQRAEAKPAEPSKP